MFKLVLISALVALTASAPADKPKQGLETSETMWNAAWVDPRVAPVAAAATAAPWNRWNNPAVPTAAVDPRWNRWGAPAAAAGAVDPWNRWGANPAAWNRAAPVVPATAAAAVAGNRAWYPW